MERTKSDADLKPYGKKSTETTQSLPFLFELKMLGNSNCLLPRLFFFRWVLKVREAYSNPQNYILQLGSKWKCCATLEEEMNQTSKPSFSGEPAVSFGPMLATFPKPKHRQTWKPGKFEDGNVSIGIRIVNSTIKGMGPDFEWNIFEWFDAVPVVFFFGYFPRSHVFSGWMDVFMRDLYRQLCQASTVTKWWVLVDIYI